MKYRTGTFQLPDGYFVQNVFDSSDNMFFVILYDSRGCKIKNCDKSISERGADHNLQLYLVSRPDLV